MRYLIAPNAFKGSLSAVQAARAMAAGVRRSGGTAVVSPVADGGDGTLDVLRTPLRLKIRRSKVVGPSGTPLSTPWGFNKKKRWAVIEMAKSSGLALLKDRERDPLKTTSYGTGQLIRAAVRAGAKRIVLGLGGSATVDGGLGLLQALGARVTVRKAGKATRLQRPFTGGDLAVLDEVDPTPVDRFMKGVALRVLCDVRNPLLGPRGSARAFGPQKGATLSAVVRLERGLQRMSALARTMGKDISRIPGTGAAGGAGAGLLAFMSTRLEHGTDTVFQLIGLREKIKKADVVMTGEGRVDQGSWEGKAVGELVRLCHRQHKKVVVLAGETDHGGYRRGVAVMPIGSPRMRRQEKMRKAEQLIRNAASACAMGHGTGE